MNSTTTRCCILIDACAIIDICELGWWKAVVDKCTLGVPSYVVEEAEYYVGSEGWQELVGLDGYIETGSVEKLTARPGEMAALKEIFTGARLSTIDPGEAEALALVCSGRANEYLFCSTDGPAIECLSLMGCSETGISMEEMLLRIGLTLPNGTPDKCRQPFFNSFLDSGKQKRIAGDGLLESPF